MDLQRTAEHTNTQIPRHPTYNRRSISSFVLNLEIKTGGGSTATDRYRMWKTLFKAGICPPGTKSFSIFILFHVVLIVSIFSFRWMMVLGVPKMVDQGTERNIDGVISFFNYCRLFLFVFLCCFYHRRWWWSMSAEEGRWVPKKVNEGTEHFTAGIVMFLLSFLLSFFYYCRLFLFFFLCCFYHGRWCGYHHCFGGILTYHSRQERTSKNASCITPANVVITLEKRTVTDPTSMFSLKKPAGA